MTEIPRVLVIGPNQPAVAETPAIVGSKAAGLMRLTQLGLRVPPAVVLTTAACQEFLAFGSLSAGALAELADAVHQLETATTLTFGGRWPLIVSVRPSPPAEIPGMMRAVVNVGVTERTVAGLIRRTGNPWFAWDAYRRLVRSFADAARSGSAAALLDRCEAAYLTAAHALSIQELDAPSLRELACKLAQVLETQELALPQDPFTQLSSAVESILTSWDSLRKKADRQLDGFDEQGGMAVLVQSMVFGTTGCRSGSGVAFTRNPSTGVAELYADFALTGQGEDLEASHASVSGRVDLHQLMPELWSQLQTTGEALEREFLDMQDFEFTIEDGELYILDTHTGRRTSWAALQIAIDLVQTGIIDRATALQRLSPVKIDEISRMIACPGPIPPVAHASAASGGVATGRIALDERRAQQLAVSGPVILVLDVLPSDDAPGLASAAGIVTRFGVKTSRAAVAAGEQGVVCLVGCADLHVNHEDRTCSFGCHTIAEGDVITLDGERGSIYAGSIPVVTDRPIAALATVATWRRELGLPHSDKPLEPVADRDAR
jgi:pyruvate,orthophosphate dikinase